MLKTILLLSLNYYLLYSASVFTSTTNGPDDTWSMLSTVLVMSLPSSTSKGSSNTLLQPLFKQNIHKLYYYQLINLLSGK